MNNCRGKGLKGLALAVCLFLLCSCTAGGRAVPQPTPAPTLGAGELCRIVDGAQTGDLLLAAQTGGELYRVVGGELPVTLDGQPARAADLRDGMLVRVQSDGGIRAIWPAQFYKPQSLDAQSAGLDDRCGLVLQVFEDLWQQDQPLNSGVSRVGVYIDPVLVPGEAERAGIACRFGELYGLEPLQGSWEALVEEGYIDGERLAWPDGCFFSIEAPSEGGGGGQGAGELRFDAQKWRGGDGACFFANCTAAARQVGDGSWQYQVGGMAVA